ncbi:MAG: hypothetical protein HQK63_17405 [Desulfamplus sp.]|nr:hypothetical protein [Desulfamplus sp.]
MRMDSVIKTEEFEVLSSKFDLQETIKQLKKVSVTERIYLMEIILESLKRDIKNTETIRHQPLKKFIARPFNLGGDVNVDRDIIYSERGF